MIFHNIHAIEEQDFTIFRRESMKTIEQVMIDFGKFVATGLFEIISVNASEHMFCVTVATPYKWDEGVSDAIFNVG